MITGIEQIGVPKFFSINVDGILIGRGNDFDNLITDYGDGELKLINSEIISIMDLMGFVNEGIIDRATLMIYGTSGTVGFRMKLVIGPYLDLIKDDSLSSPVAEVCIIDRGMLPPRFLRTEFVSLAVSSMNCRVIHHDMETGDIYNRITEPLIKSNVVVFGADVIDKVKKPIRGKMNIVVGDVTGKDISGFFHYENLDAFLDKALSNFLEINRIVIMDGGEVAKEFDKLITRHILLMTRGIVDEADTIVIPRIDPTLFMGDDNAFNIMTDDQEEFLALHQEFKSKYLMGL